MSAMEKWGPGGVLGLGDHAHRPSTWVSRGLPKCVRNQRYQVLICFVNTKRQDSFEIDRGHLKTSSWITMRIIAMMAPIIAPLLAAGFIPYFEESNLRPAWAKDKLAHELFERRPRPLRASGRGVQYHLCTNQAETTGARGSFLGLVP